MGVGIAITVNGQIIHHIDVQNSVPEVIRHRLRGSRHGLQEIILTGQIVPHGGNIPRLSGGMDVRLPGCRGNTDGLVLDHTAKAAHGMPFEMGQIDHEIIIL